MRQLLKLYNLAWRDAVRVVLGLTIVCMTVAAMAQGRETTADKSVNIDTEKAIQRIGGKWFDIESGHYRPPILPTPIDDTIRRAGWEGSQKPINTNSNWNGWSWGNLGLNGETFGWIVFGVLGTVLLFGLIMIAYYYFSDYVPVLKRKADKNAVKIDPTRIEDLPFEVPAVSDDPLGQVESLMRSGRFNEATVLLFGYMLLVLDQARKIHLQKGKTNRMYLRELRGEAQLQSIVNSTMLAFEDVFFGRYDIDRARFETLWQQRGEFHRLASPTAAVANELTAKVATV